MIKIIFLILLFLISCSTSSKATSSNINFEQVLKNQNLSDFDKLIELQIQISKQEDQILKIQKDANNLQNSFDSLKTSNDSIIFF